MCVGRDNLINAEKERKMDYWKNLFNKKPVKPKLTRKIVASAKLNLNRYWNKFEELLSSENNSQQLNNRPINQIEPKDITKTFLNQNNIQDELNTLITKRFIVEKNFARRSSMYKHFNDESLYHGVNLNIPRQRCSCYENICISPDTTNTKYPFNHRNITFNREDEENLENESMEVYTNLAYYDTSF